MDFETIDLAEIFGIFFDLIIILWIDLVVGVIGEGLGVEDVGIISRCNF